MDITLDITKRFNTLVNYYCFFDGPVMNPVIFLNLSDKISDSIDFELMNFGLNLNQEMKRDFIQKSPYFDDIAKCEYPFSRIIIFGRAKFCITGIKGADIEFASKDIQTEKQNLYYTWPYKVEKDDYDFVCGGYSSNQPYFSTVHFIANNKAKATITFSSHEYLLIDSEKEGLEDFASSKQTPYNYLQTQIQEFPIICTNIAGKMFNLDFRNKHFDLVYGKDIHTTIATNSEE